MRIPALALLVAVATAPAQSITTLFTGNTFVPPGGAAYFDLTPTAPITLQSLAVNLLSPVGTPGTIEVLVCAGSRTGNELNPGAWALVASSPVVSAGPNLPSLVAIPPVALGGAPLGMALRGIGVNLGLTFGNGNQSFTGPSLTLAAGEATNVAFTAPLLQPRLVNCRLGYTVGSGGVTATAQPYGSSCVPPSFASFYEQFAAGSIDLAGQQMTMVFTGTGYVMIPGLSPFRSTAAAASLALTDDSETTIALGGTFNFPGGSTSSMTVCSNGFVSVGGGNGTGFTPTPIALLAMPQTVYGCWHDLNPRAAGSGQVMFELAGSLAVFTWDGVGDFGGAGTSTFQLQFDLGTGFVHFIWQAMSSGGNGWVVGHSPGGANLDPGNRDLSASIPATFQVGRDSSGFLLSTASRPLLGTTLPLQTADIPAGALAAALVFGVTARQPGIDLTPLGLSGCLRHLDVTDQLLLLSPPPSWSLGLAIPNNNALLSVNVFCQSLLIRVAPTAPGFGATSNALALRLGNS